MNQCFKVLDIALVAGNRAPEVLQPRVRSLTNPGSFVAPEFPPVLVRRHRVVPPLRDDRLDLTLHEQAAPAVAIVAAICNQTLRLVRATAGTPTALHLDAVEGPCEECHFRRGSLLHGCSDINVDGNAPSPLRHYLEAEARRHDFQLIHTDHYLSPNQARNLGLQHVQTKYVVFLDNDVLVTPGWLEALVRCAEETEEAWVVGPLYLQDPLEDQIIHMAGGTIDMTEEQGKRLLTAKLNFLGKPLSALPTPLRRAPTDYVEFHCTLVRTEVFEKLGPLDEKLLSSREHLDLCLTVREAGGVVYLAPDAVVTYMYPPPLAWSDLPYFMLRWSEAWNTATLDHFKTKWNVQLHDRQMAILRHHRHACLAPVNGVLRQVFGRHASRLEQSLLYPVERKINQLLIRHIP